MARSPTAELPGPVSRTRSVTVLTILAVGTGTTMALGGLILAEPAVFGAGTLLLFQGLLLFIGVRFFAIAANQQIEAIRHQTQTPAATPGPANAPPGRPARPRRAGIPQRQVRCPRCQHVQPWTSTSMECLECGYGRVAIEH